MILRGWVNASTPISYTPLSTFGCTGNGLVPAELLARLRFGFELTALPDARGTIERLARGFGRVGPCGLYGVEISAVIRPHIGGLTESGGCRQQQGRQGGG